MILAVLTDAGVQVPEPVASSSQPAVNLALVGRGLQQAFDLSGTCTRVHKLTH